MRKSDKKVTILITTGLYSPEIGGPATYTKILEEELPKQDIVVKVAPFSLVRPYPKVIRHIVYFFYTTYKAVGVDVVYALDPVSVGFPSALVARILNKRFIVRIAGDYAWEQGTERFDVSESLDTFSKVASGYPMFVQLLKRIQKFVTSDAEIVIVPSKYLKRVVTNWGVSKDSVVIIYNSFDVPEGLAKREVLRNLMRLQGNVIMSAGRLVSWKGFGALIKVMPDVIKKYPDVKLMIAGSGREEPTLQKLIIEQKLEKNVVLMGKLDKNTLHNYIKASDVFVLNTFYEGLSHQLLECMAIGVPIVTTKAGGNSELIEHNKSGLLITYNDKKALLENILYVLSHKQEVEKMTTNAKLKVKEFNRNKMISELIDIL